MNPFDLKTALLEKHAQHVVLIHFPIALFITSFLFDLLGRWRRDQRLSTAAYYNLVGAAIAAVPTVVQVVESAMLPSWSRRTPRWKEDERRRRYKVRGRPRPRSAPMRMAAPTATRSSVTPT